MLTTEEAAASLNESGIELKGRPTTGADIRELARLGIFPGARKDDRSGRWRIPKEDIDNFVQARQGKRDLKTINWRSPEALGVIIATVTLLVTLIALVIALPSPLRDAVDLAQEFILPTATPTPTPVPTPTPLPTSTPSLPVCTVSLPFGDCTGVYDSPKSVNQGAEVLACLPDGTALEVVSLVPGLLRTYYQIESYHFDGPLVVTGVVADSPANAVGLRIGDIIVSIDDRRFRDTDSLIEYVKESAGSTVKLQVKRIDDELELAVVPRVSPPEGQGPIGFSMLGGTIEGGGGYVLTPGVTCADEE